MSDFSDYDDLTWFATIVGAHGIKGAVRVKFFTETPEYYLSVKLFFLENAGQLLPLKVSRILPSKKGWIILFEEIEDRNAAENIKGCRLLLPDEQLKPLESDEFFVHKLIGCRVEDQNGRFLGEVVDFLETGANNVYEVHNGESEFLIPDVPHVVLELDLEKQLIVIDPLPGLIENLAPESDAAL
ncbi:MAG: ribosome maturation factor RimM [SAR324 cluster bacterium]|nr:ribosome maturation factor RimM [SAR324 cluster bacterium]